MVTRRTFGGLAAASLLSAASESKIRAAVIGTGHGHALSKIRALRAMPEYELVGVCRPDSADEPPAPSDVPALTVRRILDDGAIELVCIETADVDRNLDLAEQFVGANRFVHFDKPPGADLARLRRLLDEAARRKRVVQMGYQWRYQTAMQAVVEAARSGWLGEVYRFHASIDKLVGPEERRHLAKFPGGLMFSEGCHLVDRAVAVLGKPKKVSGFFRQDSRLKDGLADNTLAVLEYDSALAEISLAGFRSNGTPYRFLEVLGTKGSARMQPYTYPSQLTVDLTEAAGPYKAGVQMLELSAPPGPTYSPDFREMAGIIRRDERPSHSAEHDLIVQETLLRVCGMLR